MHIKYPFAFFNIIIASVYTICMIFLIIFLCAFGLPLKLKTATGTVQSFKYNEPLNAFTEIVLDDKSYFDVKFTDGSHFRATGYYDKIDKSLFSELSVGDTITLTYKDSNDNFIYGIEYNGKIYMDANAISSELKGEQHTTAIVCPTLMAVLTVVAGGLVLLNYKKNKSKRK